MLLVCLEHDALLSGSDDEPVDPELLRTRGGLRREKQPGACQGEGERDQTTPGMTEFIAQGLQLGGDGSMITFGREVSAAIRERVC